MSTIDVLIPAHNAEQTLERALRSAKRQTHPAGRIWVLADTCEDDTTKIAEQYGAKVVELQAKSVASARNLGLQVSNASYVAFLDADDEWAPGWIQAGLAAMGQSPDALLYFGGVEERNEQNEVVRFSPARSPTQTSSHDLALNNFVSTSACIVHRESALIAGGFDIELQNASDWDLWLRLSQMGPLIPVPGHHAVYHRNAQSLSRAPNQMLHARDDALRVLEKARGRGVFSNDTLRVARANVLSLSAMRLLSQGRVREARIDLRAALDESPTLMRAWLLAIWSGLPYRLQSAAADVRQRLRKYR